VGGRGRSRIGLHAAQPAVDGHTVGGSPAASALGAAGAAAGTRVLLVSSDRRFRSTAAALLTRRGCSVAVADPTESVSELARAGHAHVVILDAGHSAVSVAHQAVEVEALRPPVGVVLVVGDETEQVLSRMPMHTRWESFDRLYTAIARARRAAMGVM
jgi:DNA-binding NtrC family response regulator